MSGSAPSSDPVQKRRLESHGKCHLFTTTLWPTCTDQVRQSPPGSDDIFFPTCDNGKMSRSGPSFDLIADSHAVALAGIFKNLLGLLAPLI